MAGETQITVIGNAVADPELRFTPGGDAVANFTVASTPRVFKNGEWADGDTLFMRVSAWRELGENTAESVQKGMRLVVTGILKQRSYDTKEGEKRTVIELEAQEVAPSLKYAVAKVNRTQRSGNGQGGGQGGFGGGQQGQGGFGGQQGGQQGYGGQQGGQGGFGGQRQDDPWATPTGNQGGGGWGNGPGSEPPF